MSRTSSPSARTPIDRQAVRRRPGPHTAPQVRRTLRIRRAAATCVVLVAALVLGSTLSAPLTGRLELLLELLPFALIGSATATGAVVAVALMLMARGLWHGHRTAWAGSIGLLLASVVMNLVKGLDVEEAVVSALLLTWLLLRRNAFRVRPTAQQVRVAVVGGAAAAVAAVALSTVLVLALGSDGRPRPGETLRAAAERLGGNSHLPLAELNAFVTPALGALGLAVPAVAAWLVLAPRWRATSRYDAHVADRERARVIVESHGAGSLDYFALRDDKSWFFADDSVVAYAVRAGTCLVSPDPIGPVQERVQVWADFLRFAVDRGWTVAVVGAAAPWLDLYRSSGLSAAYLGDEAVVDVDSFSLAGSAMKALRQGVARVERAGVRAEFIDPAQATEPIRQELLEITRQSRRGGAERGFSMTLSRLCDPADAGLLVALARDHRGRAVGFLQWVPAPGLPGWSLDVMRRDLADDVPAGVMDFLVVATIRHVSASPGRRLALNFAVLRRSLTTESLAEASVVTRKAVDMAASRSQLRSLARFNDKYRPSWEPRYLVHGAGVHAITQLAAVMDAEGLLPTSRPPRNRSDTPVTSRPRSSGPSSPSR